MIDGYKSGVGGGQPTAARRRESMGFFIWGAEVSMSGQIFSGVGCHL